MRSGPLNVKSGKASRQTGGAGDAGSFLPESPLLQPPVPSRQRTEDRHASQGSVAPLSPKEQIKGGESFTFPLQLSRSRPA